jgi:uncharacterized SAM-binding protein YcdF (DUF218 family)
MNHASHKWCGFLVRRERWSLSWRGWLVGLLAGLGAIIALGRGLFSLLAVYAPTSGEILVVEGWIHSGSVMQAAQVCLWASPTTLTPPLSQREREETTGFSSTLCVDKALKGNYQDVVVVVAVTDAKSKWDSGRYRAEYIAGALESAGVPKDRIQVLLCDAVQKDRTYACARAVREWLQKREKPVQAIDVVTIGSHARRSRLLFQKAMGSTIRVGVLAMDERGYDPVHWWRSSEGVREVLFEGVAYLYVRLFFAAGE